MAKTEEIIALYRRKEELEVELERVKKKLERVALFCAAREISALSADGLDLEIVCRPYAHFLGEGSGGEALHRIGMKDYVRYSYISTDLAELILRNGASEGQAVKFGDSAGPFAVERHGWFRLMQGKKRKPWRGKRAKPKAS